MKLALHCGAPALFTDSGELWAYDITAGLRYPGDKYNTLKARTVGNWTIDGMSAFCDNVRMDFTPCEEGGMLVRTQYTHMGDDIADGGRFFAFCCTLCDAPERLYTVRPTCTNGNRVHEMQSNIDVVRPVWGERFESADFVFGDMRRGGDGFLFGFAGFENRFGSVEVCGEGIYRAFQYMEGHPVRRSETIVSDEIYISPAPSDANDALIQYAETVRRLSGAVPTHFDTPAGFCTWYYYGYLVRSSDVRENLAFLKNTLPKVKYIQTDDGWYDCWGDWQPNDRFDFDMEKLAREIREAGFIPGIWISPFGADKNSKVCREHPEYFVKTKSGEMWQPPCLDMSNDAAREHLKSVIRRIVSWGIGYIKMDIITGTLAPGVHVDPDFTALCNYRAGLRCVREAAGDDVFLLGCTAPLAAGCGLVDGMRISGDIFESWDSLLSVFNCVFKRSYMNRRYFITDADCLLVRTKDEEDGRCFRPCSRTPEEIRTYVTAMAASGGALMLSDKMTLLKPWQLELIEKLFPQNCAPARPLDIMESFVPGVLDFGTRHGVRTAALINWGDTKRRMSVPDSASKLVFEFWSQRFLGLSETDVSDEIEPHGCRVYFLSEPLGEGESAVVGTDASVVMDICAARGKEICAEKNKDGEVLTAVRKNSSEGYEIFTI